MIVLVHGSQSDQRVWGPLVGLAPAGTRVCAFDLPDHGSAPDEPTPDPEPLRRALVEHIEGLPDASVTLVGHSLGAHLIASIATRISKPVERAVLISGFDVLHDADRALYRAMADGLETGRLDLELLREMALDAAVGEADLLEERRALVTQMQVMPFERAVRSLRRGLALGPPSVCGYDFEATVLHGQDDAAIRFELGEELAAAGSQSRLVALDTDSHLLPLTHPEQLAPYIFGDAR